MKRLIKIISNIPCYLKVNNFNFFVENSKILELIDEENVFFTAMPQDSEYIPIYYYLDNNISKTHKNIRITKYNGNLKLELFFSNYSKIKNYSNENLSIYYYNDYYLKYKNNTFLLDNFTHNIYHLSTKNINSRYILIEGHYRIDEENSKNDKIDIAILDTSLNAIIHKDSCSATKIDNNIFKVISYMNDQNKQVLICEFDISNNSFLKKDFYSSYTKQKPSNLTKKYQINQAFFECILSQNKNLISFYLNDDLKNKVKDKNLHLMFNNFVKIDTDFLTNIDEVNLITKTSRKNIYTATTYKIEYINNKISNIISI